MAVYTVTRPNKNVTERNYGVVTIDEKNYTVFRTSPLFGDFGYGAVTINGRTFSVYRAKKEEGDIGYGVVNVEKKTQKKPLRPQAKKLPDELAEIVSSWSELPEDIKTKIEALVKTHRKE